jgi:two-component system, OmpR family, response regulator
MTVLTFVSQGSLHTRIAKALNAAQFDMKTVASRQECLRAAQLEHHDGVLIDSDSLIFVDAVALVQQLRHEQSDSPIFVVSRHLDLERRLSLFEAGVDDCVCGQFFASELVVRLGLSISLRQAASKLASSNTVNVLHCGDLELDLVRRRVSRLGKRIDLRPKEFALLEYMARNVNRPVTRTMILEHVWKSSFEGLTNVVDVYVSSLRSKVDRGFEQQLIQTNRGVGYTFTCANGLRPPPRARANEPAEDSAKRGPSSSEICSERS